MTEKKRIAIQDNELINARYDLTLGAKRLLLLAASRLNAKAMPQYQDFVVTVKEWRDCYGTDPDCWRSLRQAATDLYESELILPLREQATRRQRWVENCEYHPGASLVSFRFTQVVETYLTNQHEAFTRLELERIKSLRSVYSIRIYELCRQFRDTGWRQISVAELRAILRIEDKYPRFDNLRARVLDRAVREISDKTNTAMTWRPIKTGRTVTAIRFTFKERLTLAK